MIRNHHGMAILGALCLLLMAPACSGPEPTAITLVSRFADVTMENPYEPEKLPVHTEWRFDGDGTVEAPEKRKGTWGWEALNDIRNLGVRDGALTGRTGDTPILLVQAPENLDESDRLFAIEIRLRVSAGSRLGVSFDGEEELDTKQYIKEAKESFLSGLNTELTPGDRFRTYTLTGRDSSFSTSFPFSRIKHVLIRPTDAADADFAIESVKLISLKEHLGAIASGIGWQGLGEVYRETIVSRAPERLSFQIDLPSEPFLDLAIGTVEDGPITFRVEARTGGPESPATMLLQRTVTTPQRWEQIPLSLDDLAGRQVTLSFTLEAEEDGRIGFWGSPVIRNRAGLPTIEPSAQARAALTDGDVPPPQGVILIIADTLRRDHLETYGYRRPTAPVLAGMASQGVLFRDALSQGTWTKISVPSILTSLYPSTHGIVDLPDRLPASVTTLPEAYHNAGYATFTTSSVPFTGKLTNLHQGVEVLNERTSVEDDGGFRSKTARTFVDRLLAWIEVQKDVPFFAMLHIFDPHSPFEPYSPYDTLWMDADAVASHKDDMETIKEFIEQDFMKRQSLPTQKEIDKSGLDTAAYVQREKDWYDASIRAMDVEIGRLLERLQELDLDERTLIAFVSDHGEEFLEHGRHFHGWTTYGEMINVPMMLWWPGVLPAGVTVDETVQSIDLMPTLLQLSRLGGPEEMQGQSLLPLLARPDNPSSLGWEKRPAFAERAIPPSDAESYAEEQVESFTIVQDGWKLVKNGTRPPDWPEYELYDHNADPLNMDDVAENNPEIVERLAARLDVWHQKALEARVSTEQSTEGLSPDELQRLRSLGYID